MIRKDIKNLIQREFFDRPAKKFQLRELARALKVGLPTAKRAVERLAKEGIVERGTNGIYPYYTASRTEAYSIRRRLDVQLRLQESGLIEYLVEKLTPDAIVLFGSASRGEDVETSDIDLFVVSSEKELETAAFERQLKRKIHMIFEPYPKKAPKELLNNVINGIVVYGYLKVL
ncbi:MAG: nucleotidyltransferase domain-containing protein [Candidatus Aenigmarchaeota archaeon]|nr:nucleotidyltransferase domain-containing protein [Candidatus Aenigmarchaeota archaeon]